ncbi:hypothetical protein PV04_02062 [Phialophora macrospora]|uniref:Cyanovirin-N domain-containing protein n=1 Tax=Phialophora macrospora TaxID=1851006 RepID=A0A0D2GNN6_9EURO|nr:hypothetical protein PV04_02062 [Phialophora macrospora]
MKTFVSVTNVLAFASVAMAGLVPKSEQSPNIPMKIGCYPTGNNPVPNAMQIKLPTCDGLLNGDNCLRFCKWYDETSKILTQDVKITDHCADSNEKSEVVCDSDDMSGCSDKEMSKVCGQTGEDADWHGYFYCSCWPA